LSLWDLCKQIPILTVAQDLGIKIVKDSGSYAVAVCPFHEDHVGGGGKPNLSLLKTKNSFNCFNCKEHGTVIDLFSKMVKVDPKAAVASLAQKYHIEDPQAKPQPKKKFKKPKTWGIDQVNAAHEKLLLEESKDHLDYFLGLRKMTKEYLVSKRIGITFIYGGLYYTIPCFAKDGSLSTCRLHSRTNRQDKKYVSGKYQGKADDESTSKYLYDLTSYKPEAAEFWVVEGEGDHWTLEHTLGQTVITSMCGASALPSTFDAYMKDLGDLNHKTRIIFAPDHDKVGEETMARVRILMPKEAKCFRIHWPANYTKKEDISYWVHDEHRTLEQLQNHIKTFSWEEAQEIVQKSDKKAKEVKELLASGMRVKEEECCYFRLRKGKEVGWDRISNFVIRGKATVELDDGRSFTRSDIVTPNGVKEKDKQLPPEIWLGKRDFLKGFPNTEYEFIGNENDVQQIKTLVRKTISKDNQKKGVEYIGFVDDFFVGPGFAIGPNGVEENPKIEYVKQGVPLETAIKVATGESTKEILEQFTGTILNVNKPPVIIPSVGWIFSCFFKDKLKDLLGYFPLMSFFGSSGAGKTSYVMAILRIFGLKRGTMLMNAHATGFTTMRMLASTNCVPLVVDEIKEDAGRDTIEFWKNRARSSYSGETETRGKQDLTVQSFPYRAPLAFLGEMSILREQATTERTVAIEPKRSAHTKETRDAFKALRDIDLAALFPEIARWCVSEGRPKTGEMWAQARKDITEMKLPYLTDRVWDNMTVVVFGLNALETFCKWMEVPFTFSDELRRDAFNPMIAEILNVGKRSRMALDDFLEALAIMSKIGAIKKDQDYDRDGEWLYIHLPSCVSAFRKWARDTQWDGERLGRKEYRNQAKENTKVKSGRYVYDCDKRWRFDQHTAVTIQISLRRAEAAGLDVSGFGWTAAPAPEQWENKTPDATEEAEEEPAQREPEYQLPAELTQEPVQEEMFPPDEPKEGEQPTEEPPPTEGGDDMFGGE
jgi:hypothetical protein